MTLAADPSRPAGRRQPFQGARTPQARPAAQTPMDSLRASQARAALRRDARRDEVAVSFWLRELSNAGRR
jgi:hypothetical protein